MHSYPTRFQLKKEEDAEMTEAAHILVQMSQTPRYLRELPIRQDAMKRARELFPSCQEGDTILLNFFVDRNEYASVRYIQKQDGQMQMHRIDAPYSTITIPWTHQVTDFRF